MEQIQYERHLVGPGPTPLRFATPGHFASGVILSYFATDLLAQSLAALTIVPRSVLASMITLQAVPEFIFAAAHVGLVIWAAICLSGRRPWRWVAIFFIILLTLSKLRQTHWQLTAPGFYWRLALHSALSLSIHCAILSIITIGVLGKEGEPRRSFLRRRLAICALTGLWVLANAALTIYVFYVTHVQLLEDLPARAYVRPGLGMMFYFACACVVAYYLFAGRNNQRLSNPVPLWLAIGILFAGMATQTVGNGYRSGGLGLLWAAGVLLQQLSMFAMTLLLTRPWDELEPPV